MAITLSTDLSKRVREECGENVYLCYQCERCSSGCPTVPAMRYRPAQMMRLTQFGLEDTLAADASIWQCVGCDNCTQHCPHNLSVRRLVEVMRQHVMQERYLVGGVDAVAPPTGENEILRKGLRALGMLGERVSAYHNVSGEDNAARLAWTDNLAEKPEGLVRDSRAELVYFVGCVSAMFPMSYGIPQSFATVLGRAGVRFTTLGDEEECCGYPLLMAGQLKQAEALIRHNVEQVRALGVGADGRHPRVVTTCPSCYHMWHHTYPEVLGEPLGLEVVHAAEVLAELVGEERRLELTEPRHTGVVTYHDPCDLGRKGGIFDAPREVLRRVPGYTFVEMQQSREHALCCGGGGNLETFDPDLVQEVAARRVAQAAEVNATVLISACPQCVRTLSKAARNQKLRMRVMDLTQFVEMATAS